MKQNSTLKLQQLVSSLPKHLLSVKEKLMNMTTIRDVND